MILSFDYYMIKKDMLETYTIQELYLRGMPIPYIIGVTNKHRDDIEAEIAEVIEKRAKYSLSKIDLTPFLNEVPGAKRRITLLYLIRNELYRRTQYNRSDIEALISFERIDNIVKRTKMNPGFEWGADDDEVSIIEETGGYVTVDEIYTCENSGDKQILEYASLIKDTLLLKPDNVKSMPNDVTDKDYHIRECAKLNLDPYTTTAKRLKMDNLQSLRLSGQITKEEYDKRKKEL